MSLNPYPHQVAILNETRTAIGKHHGVLVQSATGSGKTVIGTMIAKGASEKNRRVLFTVHRDFLIEQTFDAFSSVGLDIGVIAPGWKANYMAKVQLASIDTLKHRLDLLEKIDLLIVDECHHTAASGWDKIFMHLQAKGARAIGLTATPWRLSGEGLDKYFSYMVRGPSVRWLIDNGFLSDYRAFAPSTPDLRGVHNRAGEYVNAEIEAAMDKPTITGDAVRHYLTHACGKRGVAFCCSVKHSEHVTAQFLSVGVSAAHIDSHTPRGERKRIINLFRAGDIRVLSSVNIFGEGFDIPAVEAAILLRPTQSLSLHLQQVGRSLRTFAGKDRAIILDHAGNLMRHGLPDTEIDWSLHSRKKKKKKNDQGPPVRQCEVCYFVYSPPVAICPNCGHLHALMDRSPDEVEGELQEITPEMKQKMHAEKRKEVFKAQTKDELAALGKSRGYSPGWADNVFAARERAASQRAASQAQAYMRV